MEMGSRRAAEAVFDIHIESVADRAMRARMTHCVFLPMTWRILSEINWSSLYLEKARARMNPPRKRTIMGSKKGRKTSWVPKPPHTISKKAMMNEVMNSGRISESHSAAATKSTARTTRP
jgi:hypothetical protein